MAEDLLHPGAIVKDRWKVVSIQTELHSNLWILLSIIIEVEVEGVSVTTS